MLQLRAVALGLRAMALALVLAVTAFAVVPDTASAHHKPCHPKSLCEVPEVPWPLVLPAASVGVAGAYYLVNRVRGGGGDSEDE